MFNYNLKIALESILLATLVVFIAITGFRDFYIIDDVSNETLPYYRQYGKYLLEGIFPYILDNTFAATNTLAQYTKSPLAPQTFIIALLSRIINSPWKIGAIFAVINYSIIAYFSFILVNKLFRSKISQYLSVGFILVQPFAFYQSAGWWNMAIAHTWAIACFAIIISAYYENSFSRKKQFLLCIFEIFLFFSGLVQAAIAVGISHLIYLLFTLRKKDFKTCVDLFFVGLISLSVFLFLHADFIYLKYNNFILGYSAFSNDGYFQINWKQLILNFYPTLFEYIGYWGGYKYVPIQWSFTSCFGLVALIIFFSRYRRITSFDKFCIGNIIIFFLLLNSPQNVGEIHYSFRYTYFYTFFVTIFTFKIIDNFIYQEKDIFQIISKQKIVIIALFSFVISLFSSFGNLKFNLAFNLLSVLILVFSSIYIKRFYKIFENRHFAIFSVTYPFFILIVFVLGFKSIGARYVIYPTLEKFTEYKNIDRSYFYLGLDVDPNSPIKLHHLFSGRFLVYDIPSVNGYSTAHHVDLNNLFGWYMNQLYFDSKKTLLYLFSYNNFAKTCNARALNIGHISVKDTIATEFENQIQSCNYSILKNSDNISDLKINNYSRKYFQPYVNSIDNISYKILKRTPNLVLLHFDSSKSDVNVIIPRVYWPGYKLYINNHEQKIIRDSNFPFIKFSLNSGQFHDVKLIYVPFFMQFLVEFLLFIVFEFLIKFFLDYRLTKSLK